MPLLTPSTFAVASPAARRRFTLGCLAAALVLIASAPVAHAEVVYNNMSAFNNGSDGIGYYGPVFNSFSSGAGTNSLANVSVDLAQSGNMTATTTIGLYSSASSAALLTSIGTVNNGLVTSDSSILNFPLITPYTLSPNTQYWIGLIATSQSSPAWNLSQSGAGIGLSGQSMSNAFFSLPASSYAYQMYVEVVPAAPVPEIDPAGMGSVLALVGGALGLLERRRRVVA